MIRGLRVIVCCPKDTVLSCDSKCANMIVLALMYELERTSLDVGVDIRM